MRVMSLYHNENVTIQWCMITEACAKGDSGHRFGGVWGNQLCHLPSQPDRPQRQSQSAVGLRLRIQRLQKQCAVQLGISELLWRGSTSAGRQARPAD